MIKGQKKNEAQLLAETVVSGMQEKKAREIVLIDLSNIENAISKYFVICHGTSNQHVGAISDSVEVEVEKVFDFSPWHKEGQRLAEWILMDYSDVVVHVFQESSRNFYKLEELWADAVIKRFEDIQ
ncbi:MAG: ribosome silencing factor [Bacteroidales bacterium]|nr:ribosome silencing factor [Bacteroidales bacterium]